MNRKRVFLSYFVLAALIFMMVNLPLSFVAKLRHYFIGFAQIHAASKTVRPEDKIAELEAQAFLLKSQLKEVRGWFREEDYLDSRMKRLDDYQLLAESERSHKAYYLRRVRDMTACLERDVWQVSANVVIREPTLWNSALWIDKGEETNEKLGFKVIAKNSPVIIGGAIVGVVEEVEKNRSRVRLITDSALNPSVRCVRGYLQEESLVESMNQIKERLSMKESTKEASTLISAIDQYLESSGQEYGSLHMAKGILEGSSYPLWRMRSNVLRGIGFNYETADEEGISKELHKKHDTPILQVGDLLVTTGMDGVFPPGLIAAYVTKIFPLKEGSPAYELEAKAVADILNLQSVQILPPM